MVLGWLNAELLKSNASGLKPKRVFHLSQFYLPRYDFNLLLLKMENKPHPPCEVAPHYLLLLFFLQHINPFSLAVPTQSVPTSFPCTSNFLFTLTCNWPTPCQFFNVRAKPKWVTSSHITQDPN